MPPLVCIVIKKSLRVNFVKLKPRPHFTGEKIFDDPFAQLKLQISELWMKELVEEMFLFLNIELKSASNSYMYTVIDLLPCK